MSDALIQLGTLSLMPFRELTRDGMALPIGGKALGIVSVLAQARGALVTKDELMDAVWPGVTVEENAIQVHIAALRKALGGEAGRLKTAHGLGYRLTVDEPAMPVSTSNGKPVIAVLPFDEFSGDAAMRPFADGVSEEILISVGRIAGLRVIARSSSFQFRGTDKQPARIARDLKASHILDGSVRRAGDSVRVSAELSDTATETVIWSDRFDRPLSDFLTLQDDVAASVARALEANFIAPPPPPAIDPAALDIYLKGRALMGVPETRQESIRLLEAAVEIDPSLSGAWSALAINRGIALRWDPPFEPFSAHAAKVEKAALTALRLDPRSGIAHVALGFLQPFGRYARFEDHLNRAIEVTPADPVILTQRALLYYSLGFVREAFRLAASAYALDPLNLTTFVTYNSLLVDEGHWDESIESFMLANQRWPGIWWVLGVPWSRAAFRGDWKTVDAIERVIDLDMPGIAPVQRAVATLRDPNPGTLALVKASLDQRIAERGWLDYSTLVFAHRIGLIEETFDWIDRSDYDHLFEAESRAPDEHGLMNGTIFSENAADMRRDPRFVQLSEKLGLCAYWREKGKWPDCADDPDIPYDFRAEARRAAAA